MVEPLQEMKVRSLPQRTLGLPREMVNGEMFRML